MREAETTLVILAGGYGRRMGKPKSFLRVNETPIIEYLIERWQWRGPTMLVTAPGVEHPPGWKSVDREVCDAVGDEGPLRGIVTALEANVSRAVIVPVDMPEMTASVLRWLCEQEAVGGVFMRRNGEVESMPVLLTSAALPCAQRRLREGRRSVHGLANEPGFAVSDVPLSWPNEIWLNANVPAEWAPLVGKMQ